MNCVVDDAEGELVTAFNERNATKIRAVLLEALPGAEFIRLWVNEGGFRLKVKLGIHTKDERGILARIWRWRHAFSTRRICFRR